MTGRRYSLVFSLLSPVSSIRPLPHLPLRQDLVIHRRHGVVGEADVDGARLLVGPVALGVAVDLEHDRDGRREVAEVGALKRCLIEEELLAAGLDEAVALVWRDPDDNPFH
jgi:hypothetical protein